MNLDFLILIKTVHYETACARVIYQIFEDLASSSRFWVKCLLLLGFILKKYI